MGASSVSLASSALASETNGLLQKEAARMEAARQYLLAAVWETLLGDGRGAVSLTKVSSALILFMLELKKSRLLHTSQSAATNFYTQAATALVVTLVLFCFGASFCVLHQAGGGRRKRVASHEHRNQRRHRSAGFEALRAHDDDESECGMSDADCDYGEGDPMDQWGPQFDAGARASRLECGGRAARTLPPADVPPVRVTFDWDGTTKQGALSMSGMSSVADLLQVRSFEIQCVVCIFCLAAWQTIECVREVESIWVHLMYMMCLSLVRM